MAATLPAGIGDPNTARQATVFLREQPWYQDYLRSQGITPQQGQDAQGNVSLSKDQQQGLLDLARQKGIGISDRYEIDPNGQIAEKQGHKLRNTLIGAGIGGLALTGLGAAGIGPLTGLLGGGSAAAAAAPAAAEAAGTTAGATAAGGGSTGILGSILGAGSTTGKILNVAGELAPILGGASANQAASRAANDRNQLTRNGQVQGRYFANEALPGSRLKTSVAASKVANWSPVKAEWGGPGSGLKGNITHYTGGMANPNLISPDTRQQANDVTHQMLLKQLGNEQSPDIPGATPEGVGEKILGGAATGTSILAGLGGLTKKRPTVPGALPPYEPVGPNLPTDDRFAD